MANESLHMCPNISSHIEEIEGKSYGSMARMEDKEMNFRLYMCVWFA